MLRRSRLSGLPLAWILIIAIWCEISFCFVAEPRKCNTTPVWESILRLQHENAQWTTMSEIAVIENRWLRLIGERLKDHTGQILDYWRVEKADSAIVVAIQNGRYLFPKPMYRPGVGTSTLDFPGGRVPINQTPLEVVPHILQRELGIGHEDIMELKPLNHNGWPINSSFSNQRLWTFVAEIRPDANVDSNILNDKIYCEEDVDRLLDDLLCLQCRAALMEYCRNGNK